MITLRKALKEGKLKQFIKEYGKDEPGDLEKLDKALKRPASHSMVSWVMGWAPQAHGSLRRCQAHMDKARHQCRE